MVVSIVLGCVGLPRGLERDSCLLPVRPMPGACPHPGHRITFVITKNRSEAPMKLKITTIGNSAGVILPKELLASLRRSTGDELYALDTPDGISLTAFDPELADRQSPRLNSRH